MVNSGFDRRELVALASLGGLSIIFGSALAPQAVAQGAPAAALPEDFFFVQLSDTHWGFKDDSVNPDAEGTLNKVIAGINSLARQPDFIVFTGDMTHTTNDAKERRRRMADVRAMLGELKVKDIKYTPGDHDATPDRGEAYQEFFGKLNYTFDHKGLHFIVLDNVSDKEFRLGDAQLQWLAADLAQLPANTPVVVLTHRPLFELYRPWGWFTPDGDKALDLLRPTKATVFYGHIHHEHHTTANGLVHHAASALMIPLYPAGTRPERTVRKWDAKTPYEGMSWRSVSVRGKGAAWDMEEQPVVRG
jgi:3',5'-cyclic AMP phosphodiesterase CpdA